MIDMEARPGRPLDDDGFAEIVARDAKGKSTLSEYNMLRMPENVVRWHRELVFIRNDINDQITEARLSTDTPTHKAERLLRMRTVMKHVQRNQRMARYLMDQHDLHDFATGQIVGSMQQLEHVLAEGDYDNAKKMLEGILDRLERRGAVSAAHS